MARCTIPPKICLTGLAVIFWISAGALIFIGSWVYIQYNHVEQIAHATYTLIPATIFICLGVFFFLLGLCGCIGAFKEQRCILGLFFTLLLVIVIGMILAAVLGYVYRTDVDNALQDGFEEALKNYNDSDNNVWKTEIDFIQQNLECCGMHNYTDWLDTPWHKQHPKLDVPSSCCTNDTCSNSTLLYTAGCYDKLKDEFLSHLIVIIGTGASFAVILILGMICSCLLICRRTSEAPYIGLTSPEHMRV